MSGLHVPFLSAGQQVRMLGDAHGDPWFWRDVLLRDGNRHNIRRALLYLAHSDLDVPRTLIRARLGDNDSRTRAWACACLARLGDQASLDQLHHLTLDASARVRYHARQALCALSPDAEVERHERAQVGATALVSEDSLVNQTMLARLLTQCGLRVICASAETTTCVRARGFRPTLIVTDNQKGHDNTSGLRMTEGLAADLALSETLLFMVSADAVEGVFLWNGGDAFVHKSVGWPGRLLGLLSAFLGAEPGAAHHSGRPTGGTDGQQV